VEDLAFRLIGDLISRLSGPLTLRLFLQPGVATFLAIRDGVRDARDGRPPHFWRMLTGPPDARMRRIKETWHAVLKVFIIAVLLDCVYQFIVFRWVYPGEAMITAVVLAILPYAILRGVTNRIARAWIHPQRSMSR